MHLYMWISHFINANLVKEGSFRINGKLKIGKGRVNTITASLFTSNFHSLKVVSRRRDSQLQVSENYSDLTNMEFNHFESC